MTGRERAVTIRFPPELLEMLKRIAERDKRSLNSEVVYVLRQFAEQREEQDQRRAHEHAGSTGGRPEEDAQPPTL